ncbi:zinc finger MYM-type protein 4-like isoform X3 [Eriocheir sinensis]|uniref:zinc finger MYM-type protein 4-like isoform X3 n=1 Tax=Eriocheir sinensis TaxID=95602 RepID=UPI0021C95340|nr:zinc finger MYM-type protein 4-like isoform X3 [Eriocheir sinensis]
MYMYMFGRRGGVCWRREGGDRLANMDQAGSVEVDSTQDINSKADDEGTSNPEGSNSQPEEFISMPDEEQPQTMEEAGDMNSKSQEKPVEAVEEDIVDVPTLLTQDTLEESDVMEWDALAGDTSEVHKETNGDKLCSSSVDSSEECEAANMAVVIMDEEFPSHSENSNNESNVLDKETSDPTSSESHEFEKEDSVNPLANSSEQEKTNKESESNALEAVAVEMNSLEESDSEEICTSSKTNEDSSSSETNLNKSKTLEQANRQEKKSKKPNSSEHLEDGTASEVVSIAEVVVESSKSKPDEGEDIVELPVQKQPAMLVDLENEDEVVGESQGGSPYQTDDNVSNLVDDNATNSDGKRIKLRSLASLVDISGGEDPPANPVVSTSHPDIPAIGEIVEHGVIIGSDEMDGLQLRISNVVGGEDCITGLTVDEDRDSFSSIQISSVTTLIEPMSPEDPNKVNEKSENSQEGESSGEPSVKARAAEGEGKTSESTTEAQNSKPEVADGDMNCVVVSSKGDGKSTSGKDGKPSEERDKPSEERDKPSEEKDSESNESASPKIQHSGAISTAKGKECGPPRHIYHILRSILTMKRECHFCFKTVQCEFRIVKKGVSGPWGFLCSPFCRSQWTTSLASNHVLEKPRLIFEKLCGMCGSDLANLTRDGQYSWETREFCSKNCLTTHMTEVAGKCHTCRQTVRSVFIGKYCVRFGSDIHQFCSNTCLEHYKTKIKVCCYCQKNLDKVDKVTSVSNKEYCSTKCLKRAQRRDIGQQNYSDHLACTVCQNSNLNRYEFVSNQESFQLCSDPCLNVYKYANKVKAVTCCLCFRIMNAEDVAHYLYHGGHQLRVFCSDSCVNVFILSARKIVVCEICKVKKYNFDMIHRQVDEDFRDYFYCSLSCLCTKEQSSGKKTKNGVTSSSAAKGSVTSSSSSDPPVTDCNMCNAKAKAQYHMVMSDNTLRSFCRYACATKYKNTFGYQVNGIQNADSTQNSLPVIREVASQEAPANQSEDKENTSKTKKKNGIDPAEEISSVTAELLRLLTPPTMVNKMTSCRPSTLTKGVFCKPYPWHRQTQTASSDINCSLYTEKPPPIIPVPIPVYVPSPMMMYNMPYPVPVFVPIPLPVPIFIPTTAKTTEDIAKQMKNIREEMPEDPYEAEMLLLARASSESAQGETREAAIQENNSLPDGFDSHIADIDDLKDLDVSCLDTVEEDVPRYPLKPLAEDAEIFDSNPASDAGDSDENEQNKRKRKVENDGGGPRKRLCSSGGHNSVCDTGAMEPVPTSSALPDEALVEEYPGPFLNKMYGLAAWKRWVTTKNEELSGVSSSRNMKLMPENLLAMNCEELNYALCLFLKDITKPNGELYQPDTVFYLLLGIQQHLFDSGRTDCIFMDFGFEKLTNSFDEITKTFLSVPVPPSSPEVGVTRITETMLWECRQLGAHTPQVLLNTLFYFNTKVFKLKTVEDHQGLSFVQIVKQRKPTAHDPDGATMRTTLLKYFTPKKDGTVRTVHEMHENRDDPLRCPVKLYEFYLSKCPESLRYQQGIYYLYPERCCVPDSPTWFSSQPVQPASLSKMLHRALMVKEVQESFLE